MKFNDKGFLLKSISFKEIEEIFAMIDGNYFVRNYKKSLIMFI